MKADVVYIARLVSRAWRHHLPCCSLMHAACTLPRTLFTEGAEGRCYPRSQATQTAMADQDSSSASWGRVSHQTTSPSLSSLSVKWGLNGTSTPFSFHLDKIRKCMEDLPASNQISTATMTLPWGDRADSLEMLWFWTFRKSLTFWRGTCYTSGWMLPRNYKSILLRKTFTDGTLSTGRNNYLWAELSMSSEEGATMALNNQRSKWASSLWLLYLVFKVSYLVKTKFGKCYMLIHRCMLKFKPGVEHFQWRFTEKTWTSDN